MCGSKGVSWSGKPPVAFLRVLLVVSHSFTQNGSEHPRSDLLFCYHMAACLLLLFLPLSIALSRSGLRGLALLAHALLVALLLARARWPRIFRVLVAVPRSAPAGA